MAVLRCLKRLFLGPILCCTAGTPPPVALPQHYHYRCTPQHRAAEPRRTPFSCNLHRHLSRYISYHPSPPPACLQHHRRSPDAAPLRTMQTRRDPLTRCTYAHAPFRCLRAFVAVPVTCYRRTARAAILLCWTSATCPLPACTYIRRLSSQLPFRTSILHGLYLPNSRGCLPYLPHLHTRVPRHLHTCLYFHSTF